MSETKDIFHMSMDLANQMSPTISDSIKFYCENEKVDNMVESVIIHTMAMFIICCSLNSDVLDSQTLNETFDHTKKLIKDLRDYQRTGGKPDGETVN